MTSPMPRKKIKEEERYYEPLPHLLVRAPLQPLESYLSLSSTGPTSEFRSRLDDHPNISAAIEIAAPTLLEQFRKASPGDRKYALLKGKILRYFIRMSTRPTPYGLFAGVASGRLSDRTTLQIDSRRHRTRARVDMKWLLGFVQDLESNPEIRRQLRWMSNRSALLKAGRVYLEDARASKRKPDGGQVSVRATKPVVHALELSRKSVPYDSLASELMRLMGETRRERIDSLLTGLWENRFILSNLRVPLNEAHPAEYLAAQLRDVPAAESERDRLLAILDRAQEWNDDKTTRKMESCRKLMGLCASAEATETPLQVDMVLGLDGDEVSSQIGTEAAGLAELLLRLSPWPKGSPVLDDYHDRFMRRYGDREVPLLELLHPDWGLGSPYAPSENASVGDNAAQMERRDRILIRLAGEAIRDRRLAIDLTSEMVKSLATSDLPKDRLPASLDINVSVAAHSRDEIDKGDFIIALGPNIGAQGAGKNIGRFHDILGKDALSTLREIDSRERNLAPDALIAELIYQPRESRLANVATRPAMRRHAVYFGVWADSGSGISIPASELMVGVRNRRFYIRWTAEDKYITACSGHMLNSLHAPLACRFLEDVAREGNIPLTAFDWGAARHFQFLPRVQYGRKVLHLARWLLLVDELRTDSPMSFGRYFGSWRETWRVPRHVYLSVGDNRLLLDLDDPKQLVELHREIKAAQAGAQLQLQEMLPGLDENWVSGAQGRYATEFVVSLTRTPRTTQPGADTLPSRREVRPEFRTKPPGSDWLYVKLYIGRGLEEDVIAAPLNSFREKVISEKMATSWFYVRYEDPDPHLRVRFRGEAVRLRSDLFPAICTWANDLMASGLCWKYSFDVYEREVERYGGEIGIKIAEEIFRVDSELAMGAVQASRQRGFKIDRTAVAIFTAEQLLTSAGWGEAEAERWYGEDQTLRRFVQDEYRVRKADLLSMMLFPEQFMTSRGAAKLLELVNLKKIEYSSIMQSLTSAFRDGVMSRASDDITRSFLHMHLNRILGTRAREEDMVMGLLLRARHDLRRVEHGAAAFKLRAETNR
jgi:thiopeptide-type bacteriocin biosynthesis protein